MKSNYKKLAKLAVIFLFLFISSPTYARASEEQRKACAEEMQKAFELQSRGQTRQAFYTFKHAYQLAQQNGESPATLSTLEELFIWYRKYGYDCGLMTEPANCSGEYRSGQRQDYGANFDPHQRKMMRDFLYGVGSVVSGVLCLTVRSTFTGKFGVSFIVGGGKCMYDAISAMIEDHDKRLERISELDKITKKAVNIVETKS